MRHTWHRHEQAALATISPQLPLQSLRLLVCSPPAISGTADLDLGVSDSRYKSVLKEERGGDAGEQVVCKRPGPSAAVQYRGHCFGGKITSLSAVLLQCPPIEADAAAYWERTHTVDESIPLADLIMPQMLPPQRASPSCVIAAIAMLAPNTCSISKRQCATEIRPGPQELPLAVARPTAHCSSLQQETCQREPTGCTASHPLLQLAAVQGPLHRFSLPFVDCSTACSFGGT